MKKYIYIIIISFMGLSSCEKDDFCTQNPVTPSLILRFHDKDDVTKKKSVERFSIIAVGKTDSLFVDRNTDSIAIPLNGLDTKTVYTLKMNDVDNIKTNNKIATLTINYTTEEEYISRSCGYRFIFKDITLTSSTPSWINSLSTKDVSIINNQIKAHVQVFH
ncbi:MULTISPECIES: DUF6452 family protein [Tenacibaculum]|uniref:DUF6452 family protein n=1 Tax=Tenacibaculum TaxID=104267 RepID=UPI000B88F3B2|nr:MULTISPECIES: DUF6452 family protein [unclassified Tenacibaculum]RBW55735.1 hypothetical protein DS884_15370 [Tenacibaculum sp. E3R01]